MKFIVAENNRSGERFTISTTAIFVFIGADPNTEWLRGVIALDAHGFIATGQAALTRSAGQDRHSARHDPMLLETSLPGVFAAGDVRSGSVKRVASAVGEGAMAVRQVHEYLMA